ncbi:MAG TPA: collagen-binding domain-containing protein [Stellaceae bacterium]|nr:collagen-binding domain-containing protein [Stellaceae bacterium]
MLGYFLLFQYGIGWHADCWLTLGSTRRYFLMRHWTASIFAAIASFAAAPSVGAATIPITSVTPAQLLADFNVITAGDLSNSNDVNGPVLVGGNLSSTGPINIHHVALGSTAGTTGITGYGEVDVFGNVLAGTNASVMGSVTYIGGASNGTLSNRGTGSVLGGYAFPTSATAANNPTTFQTDVWSPLTSMSTNLAGLTANSTFDPTTGALKGVAGPNGAVFSIPLSVLESFDGAFSLAGCLSSNNPGGPCTAVIDVTGAGTLAQRFQFPTSSLAHGLPNIIVNFDNAVTLDVTNVWTASILDPLGAVVASHDLTGDVVALSYSNSSETHLPGFDCSDGLCICPPGFPGCSLAPPRAPEPASLAVLGSALASFAVLRRRRARWRERG